MFMRPTLLTLVAIATTLSAAAQDFAGAVKAGIAQAETSKAFAIPGVDASWRFLVNELKHLQHGDIGAADLSKINAEGTDPLPEIVRYHEELEVRAIRKLYESVGLTFDDGSLEEHQGGGGAVRPVHARPVRPATRGGHADAARPAHPAAPYAANNRTKPSARPGNNRPRPGAGGKRSV